MKTLLSSGLALAMLITTSATAEVLFDGSGDITGHGYTTVGASMTYDHEGDGVTVAVSKVGIMYELSYGAVSYYTLDTAATELVNAAGWTVETRAQSLYNDREWNVFFAARDNTGGFGLFLYPNKIDVQPGDWSGVTSSITGLASDYHTVRAVVAPGASSASIYIDDMANVAATVTLAGDTTASLMLGDGSTMGSGNANWDYINVNAVPEPSALALMATGLFGLLAYAWKKRT